MWVGVKVLCRKDHSVVWVSRDNELSTARFVVLHRFHILLSLHTALCVVASILNEINNVACFKATMSKEPSTGKSYNTVTK